MTWTSIDEIVNTYELEYDTSDLVGIMEALGQLRARLHPDHTGGEFESEEKREEFACVDEAIAYVRHFSRNNRSLVHVPSTGALVVPPPTALTHEPTPEELVLRRPSVPEPYVPPPSPPYIPPPPPKELPHKSARWDPRPGYDYFRGPIAAAHPRRVTPKVTATAFCIVFTSVYAFVNQLESTRAYQHALGIVAGWQMGEYQKRHQPEIVCLAALYGRLQSLNDLYGYATDLPRTSLRRYDTADISFADGLALARSIAAITDTVRISFALRRPNGYNSYNRSYHFRWNPRVNAQFTKTPRFFKTAEYRDDSLFAYDSIGTLKVVVDRYSLVGSTSRALDEAAYGIDRFAEIVQYHLSFVDRDEYGDPVGIIGSYSDQSGDPLFMPNSAMAYLTDVYAMYRLFQCDSTVEAAHDQAALWASILFNAVNESGPVLRPPPQSLDTAWESMKTSINMTVMNDSLRILALCSALRWRAHDVASRYEYAERSVRQGIAQICSTVLLVIIIISGYLAVLFGIWEKSDANWLAYIASDEGHAMVFGKVAGSYPDEFNLAQVEKAIAAKNVSGFKGMFVTSTVHPTLVNPMALAMVADYLEQGLVQELQKPDGRRWYKVVRNR